ncbi:hypothetical protein [Neisseria musculi]|uniref:Uncharacterized protein n=1 Tax=Neisseria musculi TaxID=1815583 RepID=A0A7H1MD63_9NEIS|nr:hypothetical protein [Neisseria musculi]QNT59578.1 hypothetical protein H7A79_1244 [Neisseria musculi]
MQNIPTQPQNTPDHAGKQPQVIEIPRDCVNECADTLWGYHLFAEAAESIALAIKTIAEIQRNTVIVSQADLLLQLHNQLDVHYAPANSCSYDLFEAVEDADIVAENRASR